jgi:predicted Zn-dependent peptidase
MGRLGKKKLLTWMVLAGIPFFLYAVETSGEIAGEAPGATVHPDIHRVLEASETSAERHRREITEEAGSQLFNMDINKSEVSLFISGYWKGSLDVNWGMANSTFGTYPYSENVPLLFTQETDLTLSLWIWQKWFLEASFIDGYDVNTYRAGYQGLPGETVQYVGVGNTGLDFPVFPYLDLGGDSTSSFGIYGRFGSKELQFHTLFRYDAAAREERIFLGIRERSFLYLMPDKPLRGRSFVLPDENIASVITMPEKEKLKVPTEKEVLALINKFKNINTKQYVDNVNILPFLAKNPTPGKAIKRTLNEKFDYVELQLSNGATVILKNTDFKNDEIRLTAFSPGGSSLYEANVLPNVAFATSVINDCGIGNYSPADYAKFMMGKNYSIFSNISTYEETVSGTTAPKDLETFLQHIYMIFEAPRKDKEVFERNIEQWKEQVANYENNPEYQYSKFSAKVRYPNNQRMLFLDDKTIKAMNLDQMFKVFDERFSNAADFTFIFVGNIDVENTIPWIEKYIGAIPTGKKEKIINRDFPLAKGVVDKTIYFGLADKTLVGHFTALSYEWNSDNNLANSALNNIMRIKMTENIREKMGGTYGTRFSLSPSKIPVEKVEMTISLGCQPERVDEITTEIWRTIDEVIENGPTPVELDKAKEQMIRTFETGMKENYNWTSWIKNWYDQQTPIFTLDEWKEKVNALTVDDIKKAAQYMKHDENVRTILMPEARKQ